MVDGGGLGAWDGGKRNRKTRHEGRGCDVIPMSAGANTTFFEFPNKTLRGILLPLQQRRTVLHSNSGRPCRLLCNVFGSCRGQNSIMCSEAVRVSF